MLCLASAALHTETIVHNRNEVCWRLPGTAGNIKEMQGQGAGPELLLENSTIISTRLLAKL